MVAGEVFFNVPSRFEVNVMGAFLLKTGSVFVLF